LSCKLLLSFSRFARRVPGSLLFVSQRFLGKPPLSVSIFCSQCPSLPLEIVCFFLHCFPLLCLRLEAIVLTDSMTFLPELARMYTPPNMPPTRVLTPCVSTATFFGPGVDRAPSPQLCPVYPLVFVLRMALPGGASVRFFFPHLVGSPVFDHVDQSSTKPFPYPSLCPVLFCFVV